MASKRTDPATPDTSVGVWPDHPLFPVEEGEQPPRIAFIHVTRKDRGVMLYGPMMRADELTSLDTIFERFGGGMYELVGRGTSVRDPSQPGNITRRKWYPIPGRSKPLSQDPTADELRQAEGVPPAASSAAAATPAPSSGGGGDSLLVAVLNMQATSSQNFMTLMMNMLTESKKEATEAAKLQAQQQQQFAQMMMTLSGQQQQNMIGMMTAMLQSRGGGPEEMAKYADLLRKLGVGGAKPSDEAEGADAPGFGKMLEDAADFVQGVVALKGGAVAGTNGQPIAPPLPGTAAAVAIEGMGK